MKRSVYFALLSAFFAVRAAVCYAQETPNFVVYYPPGNVFECTTPEIPVVGQVTCADCGLTIDNKNVPIDEDGSFQANVALKRGNNILNIRLKDTTGNVVEKALQIRSTLGGSELAPAPGSLPNLPALSIPPFELQQAELDEIIPNVEPVIAKHEATTYIPSAQKPSITQPSKPDKIPHNKKFARSFSISLYHRGKLIASFNSNQVIIKNNRLFVPLNLDVWEELNASVDAKNESITFNFEDKQEDISFSLDDFKALSPRSFQINNRIYIPFRSIAEMAHFQVDYKPGRIDLADIGFRIPAKAVLESNTKKTNISGYLNSDAIFIKFQDFSSIKGIKIEKHKKKDIYNVTNVKGDQVTIAFAGKDRIIIKTNKRQLYAFVFNKGPGRDLYARGYVIPLRQVMQILGYQVHWNQNNLLASVTQKTALVSRK